MRIEIPENNSGVSHIEINHNNDVIIHYHDGRAHDAGGDNKIITDHCVSQFTMYIPPLDKTLSIRRIKECDCHTCRKERGELFRDRMYVCHVCGNKRCSKIENHRFKCTGSNDLNQIGELEDV